MVSYHHSPSGVTGSYIRIAWSALRIWGLSLCQHKAAAGDGLHKPLRNSFTFMSNSLMLTCVTSYYFQLLPLSGETPGGGGLYGIAFFSVRPNLPYPVPLFCGGLDAIVHLRRCCSLLTLCIILHLNSTFNRHNIQCLSVILVQ